jgi:diaminopimelate decarboxylase
VSIRVNPAVERETLATHARIATGHDEAKFGVPADLVGAALDEIARHPELDLVGVGSHVGSQLVTTEPYVVAARTLFALAREIRARRPLAFVDTGGGFGVDYGDGCDVAPADFIRAVRKEQIAAGLGDLALLCEPGRSLVAKHGVLVACIIQRKAANHRRWILIDAGMNDLMRPALYQARHRIVPLRETPGPVAEATVAGPVCESTDDFGVHALPEDASGFVAILDAGAYGYTMASRYNGRALPAEVFVEGGRIVARTPRDPARAWIADRLRT